MNVTELFQKVFHELNKVWNAVIINENSLIVKCDATLAPLTVNFGSNDYKIPYEHLLRNTNGVCSLDITIIDKGDKDFNNAHPDGTFGFWFGLPFLREYCLVSKRFSLLHLSLWAQVGPLPAVRGGSGWTRMRKR